MLCTLPVQAAGFEQTFKEAQAAYKTGKYADAAKLFVQTADLLEKAKESAKAQMVLGNAAIAYMQAEDYTSAVKDDAGSAQIAKSGDIQCLRSNGGCLSRTGNLCACQCRLR